LHRKPPPWPGKGLSFCRACPRTICYKNPMALAGKETEGLGTHGAVFATTHWSVVLAAGQSESPLAADALERLCRNYWYPLYAYVRRRGHSPEEAQDLTQEFFWRLLHGKWLSRVDRQKGRFRAFLLMAMNHFLANEWDRAHRIKRGGRLRFESLEDGTYERHFQQDTRLEWSPAELYERRWALTLLETVVLRLRQELADTGRLAQFEALKSFLTGEQRTITYADLAVQLATTEAALKMAVQRLRHRYGELLREEIALTVAGPEEVENEFRHLMAILGA
jgi:DNA-directed RNA polymerase specialized sigma24 family protein